MKHIADAGIKLSVFDTPVHTPVAGASVTAQDDASLTQLSPGSLIKDFNDKTNVIKRCVAGFPPMEHRQVVYKSC